jgi:heat shock protein HslJ
MSLSVSPPPNRGARVAASLLAAAVAASLAGCGHSRSAESEALVPQDPGDLNGTEWVLVAMGDTDAVPPSRTVTLNVAEETASGAGPCNQFRLPFSVDGDELTTGPIAATKVACAPRVMRAERRIFQALEQADTAEIVSDELVLTGPDDVRLAFAPADDSADLGGDWYVASVASSRGLESVHGSPPRLDFADGGAVQIDSGCNTGSATWTDEGRSVSITEPRMTLKACESPAGVMEREANLTEALARVAAAETTDDTAVLFDADGAIVLVLTREKP